MITDSGPWDQSENRFDLFGIGRAIADAQWADPGAAVPVDAHWLRSDIAPARGEQRLVYLQQPVIPDSGWITFQPSLAAVNGWQHFPQAIPLSGFAFCRLQAMPAPGWARVYIEDYVGVSQMQARFDPRPLTELETRRGGRGLLTVFGEWEHLHVFEEFASHWLLARSEPSGIHVLAAGQYCEFDPPRVEATWIGHGVLSPEAWERLCGNVRHGLARRRIEPA